MLVLKNKMTAPLRITLFLLGAILVSACTTTENQAQPGNMRIPENNPMYEKGTLLIYAFDNKTGEVIWRSAVQAAVDFSLDKQARNERIEPIIRDMFRSLPTG